MKSRFELARPAATLVVAIGLATLASAAVASTATYPTAAGCSWFDSVVPPAHWVVPSQDKARLAPAVYRPGPGAFIHVGNENSAANSSIAGTWKVMFVSDGVPPNPVPAGVTTDFGTVQWHEDGTEIMISGGRPPSTGNVCMGAWQQVGPFTYKLKHIALAWVSTDTPPSMGGPGPSPAQFLGPAFIEEVVILDKSRARYQGSFTIDQFNADETAVLVHVSGTVTGVRLTVD